MRYSLSVVCVIGIMTAGAYAQTTWKTDFDGTSAATINNRFDQEGTAGWHWGWDNAEIPADEHAYDATVGIASWNAGGGGALKLLDDDLPAEGGWKSSHLAYDVGEKADGTGTLLKYGGIVVSRVKYNWTSGAGVGFGYSSSDGNHTGILGIKDGAVSISGWNTNSGFTEYAGSVAAVPGGNAGKYRTYALGWSHSSVGNALGFGTTYNVWVLKEGIGCSWSNNPADWTQIIAALKPRGPGMDAMPDMTVPDGTASGIMLGSFGPGQLPNLPGYGRTASGDLDFDWIAMMNNPTAAADIVMRPWQVDYPEPTSLLCLTGLAALALLRRRA